MDDERRNPKARRALRDEVGRLDLGDLGSVGSDATALFALGQCLGPILAGTLSDRAGGVRAGLLLSVGLLALAAVTALIQPDRPAAEPGLGD